MWYRDKSEGTLWKRPWRSLSYFYRHHFKRERKKKKKKAETMRPLTNSLWACELGAALVCKGFWGAESQ